MKMRPSIKWGYAYVQFLHLFKIRMSAPAKVYVVIYTVYHHVHKLAIEIQKGLESTGVTTKMFQGNK